MQNFKIYYTLWFSNLTLLNSYYFFVQELYFSTVLNRGHPYVLEHGYGCFCIRVFDNSSL